MLVSDILYTVLNDLIHESQKPSIDPGLYCNQAMHLSCMGMIRPGLREGQRHPGNYRDELRNAPLSTSYQ